MDDLCVTGNFGHYDFPPPQIKLGCISFLSKHNDDVIEGLMKRSDNASAEHIVCYSMTKACIESDNDLNNNL